MSPIIVVWLSRTCCRCSFCRRLICFLWNYRNRQMELNSSRMLGQNNKCGDESEEWKEDAHVRGHVRFINVTVAHDYCFFFFSTFKSLIKKDVEARECAGGQSRFLFFLSISVIYFLVCTVWPSPISTSRFTCTQSMEKSHFSQTSS